MSEENVERMVKAIEAFNRGDLEAMFQGYDPEVHFETPARGPAGKLRWN
jgi:hypothetical protein